VVARECTFTPDLSLSASSMQLHGSYMNTSSVEEGRCRRPAPDPPSYSYCPRTNSVPDRMQQAHAYVSQDVFERLIKPHADSLRPQVRPEPQSSEGASVSSISNSGMADSQSAEVSLLQFLRRQNEYEEERLRRLDELEAAHTPTWQPELDSRSRRLAERQRCRSQVPRGANSESRLHRGTDVSGSCDRSSSADFSFRPEISRAAARRPPRGFAEMSQGDLARRTARAAALREKLRQEAEQQLSFTPQLNEMPGHVRGQLRVLEEPELYVRRLRETQAVMEWARQLELEDREERSLADCTFHPQINQGAPPFVSRLAASHRAARARERCYGGGGKGGGVGLGAEDDEAAERPTQ